jgi:two-component system NarL family sensor kinase
MTGPVWFGLVNLKGALSRGYFSFRKAVDSLVWGVAARAHRKRRAGIAAQRQVELERQRLGRDLHTGVGQTLAAMRLQLELISRHCPEPPEAARAALDRLSVLVGEAVEQVRGLSQRLYPPEWQRLTMEDAARQLWELSGIPQSLQASMRIEALPQQPGLPVKVLVYRAMQEALSNVARHSRATQVEAVLESRDGLLRFMIEDNGVGFDVAAVEGGPASVASGIGLRSIREQAASLGARLDVESGAKGTKLALSAPFFEEWH